MKIDADQLIRILSVQNQPLTVSQILEQCDAEVTNRTIRRVLAKLHARGKIEKIGQSRATRYRLIETKSPYDIFSPSSLCISTGIYRC